MLLRKALFLLPALLVGLAVEAQDAGCSAQARTPLEQAYCKIRVANPSAPLPTLQELRRNPEKTQRLLLKRPAEQAGIALPPEAAAPARSAAAVPAKPANAPTPSRPRTSTAAAQLRPDSGSLVGCELRGASIRCGAEYFQLQGNLPNSRLARDALDQENRVTFAEYQGDAADSSGVMEYVTAAYRQYIESMLAIGLGSSTMSFTKFYHTFLDAQAKGTRFGERLSAMFGFLKKDKATIGVQSHYNDQLPDSIDQCMALSERLLVCDNVQQNWVYRSGAL